MNITSKPIAQGTIVAIEGRIDTTNYNEFENAVNQLFEQKVTSIYLDCSGLSYISSSGLRVFLTVQKKMMSIGGRFLLYAMQPTIKEIFDISGFSSIFAIFETEDDALK
ncbi:MAG: STAS domain-containing protein [Paludibacter sp.]|jgi:anti-anti-sigma factor|nr:STAS domain-containing protein [Paludibacter sp.]